MYIIVAAEDLIINPRDCPSLKKGDIVEIYHPEDEFSRLLLQVTTFKEDLKGSDTCHDLLDFKTQAIFILT